MESILKSYEEKFNYLGLANEKYKTLVTSILEENNYCINESSILKLKESYNAYINELISTGTFNYIINEYLYKNYNGSNLLETINAFFETIDYYPNSEVSKTILRRSSDLQRLFNSYSITVNDNSPFSILNNSFKILVKEEPNLIKKSIYRKRPLFYERRNIFEDIKNGDIEARNEFLLQNMGLVNKFALTITSDENLLDDYRQVGCLALIDAIKGFDYTKGIKFSTYAAKAIYNAFSRYDGQMSYSFSVPENIHLLIKKYSRLLWYYELDNNNLADDIACAILKINSSTLNLVKKNYHAISLSEKPGSRCYSYLTDSTTDGYLSIADLIPDDDNFVENLEEKLTYREVDKLVEESGITGKQKACFLEYFGFENDTDIDTKTIPKSSYYSYKEKALKKFCSEDNIEKLSSLLGEKTSENVKIYCK